MFDKSVALREVFATISAMISERPFVILKDIALKVKDWNLVRHSGIYIRGRKKCSIGDRCLLSIDIGVAMCPGSVILTVKRRAPI